MRLRKREVNGRREWYIAEASRKHHGSWEQEVVTCHQMWDPKVMVGVIRRSCPTSGEYFWDYEKSADENVMPCKWLRWPSTLRRFFGGEIREVSADAKENDQKCCLLQVAKNQALYRNPYLKVAGINFNFALVTYNKTGKIDYLDVLNNAVDTYALGFSFKSTGGVTHDPICQFDMIARCRRAAGHKQKQKI
jgi:hypothetical protein